MITLDARLRPGGLVTNTTATNNAIQMHTHAAMAFALGENVAASAIKATMIASSGCLKIGDNMPENIVRWSEEDRRSSSLCFCLCMNSSSGGIDAQGIEAVYLISGRRLRYS